MGRTNYSLNEMLNAVTKRAFNRNTSQTVDYQHLEAATTTSGLVSNRRAYSSASIIANQFSLNAQNIVESNYDPLLKFLTNDDEIVEKTIPVLGQTNTISCTDDRKFMAITFTVDNKVKVYEFDETIYTQREIILGTIDISGNTQTFDVDTNHDGSEIFVLKKDGSELRVDKFDVDLVLISSTVLYSTSDSNPGVLNVSEDGARVFTHRGQEMRIYDGLVTGSYYALTISDTSLKSVLSRNGRIVVVSYDVIPVSPIVTTSTLVYDDQNVNTTFTGTLRGAHVVTGSTGSYAYRDTTNQYIRLTTDSLNTIGTAYWQLTSGSNWTATFELYIVNDANLGTDMRFIFFAPDNLDYTDMAEDTYSAFRGSNTHGGHYVKYAYTPTHSTHSASLLDNTDSILTSATGINLAINGWMPITVTYVDGLLTSVMKFPNGGTGYTTTHDFGTTLNSHHDVPRYFGFSGRADYNSGRRAEKRVRNINIVKTTTTYPVAIPSRNETYEIPATSPTGGSVAVQAVGSQNLGVTNFDLSYDGKVMVTHTGSNALIYMWNGIEWKQFGQTISTGVSGTIVSVAISEYAEYFVVASSAQIKVYKLNNVYEQYGTTISGNFGTTGQTIDISKNGDKVIIGNPDALSGGSVSIYSFFNSVWTLIHNSTGSTSSDTLGKFVSISNNGDKYISGSENEIFIKKSSTETLSRGWSQRGNTISSSGTSLSLSNDGNNLVIGSPTTVGAVTIDGTQATGSIKIYKFSGNLWSLHGQELLGDGLTDFGKYVSITSNGSKVAIGSDKNSVVQVYNTTTPTPITNAISNVVDTVSLTPQGSSLEMSGDGNRLLLHGDVWDKNNNTWSYKDGIDQGDFMCLSNNGSYFSVGYNNIVRLYGIDSNGIVSKIGEDILPTDSSSIADTFRVTTANNGTSITVNAANTEMLNMASSYGGNTEICSLLWDSTLGLGPTINEQLTMQSVVSSGFTSPTKFGIALSRNGQALIIYDTINFFVYSSGSSEILWNFERSKSPVGGINDMVISYDGSRIAYDNGGELVIEATIVGNSLGTINVTPIASVSFKSNTVLTVVRPNLNIEMYTNTGLTWSNDTQIVSGYSSPFLQAHTKWSGDGTRLAIGDSNAERVSLYEYDTSLGWVSHSTILGGGPTQEKFGSVIDLSNDGNTVIVGAPGDGTGSYKGYVKVYDYVSGMWSLRSTILHFLSDSSTTSGDVTTLVGQRNIGKSVTMSSDGNRFGYTFDTLVTTVTNISNEIVIAGDWSNRVHNVYNGGSWNNGGLAFFSSYDVVQLNNDNTANSLSNGIWLPVTFGSVWSVTFEWYIDKSAGKEMRFVFYAPNQPSTSDAAQHGGYSVYHELEVSDQTQIRTPTESILLGFDTMRQALINAWGTVTISYNNGVLTTSVGGGTLHSYTFTGSDLSAQQALWGTPTYIAITGKNGNALLVDQYISSLNVTGTSSERTSTTKSQASIRDSVAGSLVNPIYLSDDTTPTELVNLSEDRELEAISMSYDGVRYGIRATSGDYDAATQRLHRPNTRQIYNGWTKRGDIISFTSPSMSFNSMSSSSDGNIVAFGYIDSTGTKVRVYGFSNNSWSQLGSDILPAVSNANEISIDISSDGTNLAVLVDPVTGNAVGKVFTYSSSEWSQNGSTIDFRSTGVNTIKLSGDGTTIAFGNNAPDSPFPFNIIRVYRKSQDWELISPTMTVAKSPSNYFGGGLSLTNDGSTLATFNNSGVEFSTFSTQTVSQTNYQQYLNDITVSGATIDMGDLRLTDSGERLFVMSGDEKVRVYDSTHTQETERGGVRSFSITKDGSSMVLTSDIGLTKVFNRDDTSWSQLGPVITTNMTGGGATVDIKNDGTCIVLTGSSDSLRLYKYDGGSWSLANSTSGQYGSSVFITDTNDLILGNSTNAGSVKTFEIRGVFQDTSFNAPTLSLNGDTNNRINFGTPYIELGATVTTNASTIPGVEISGAVFKDENGVYSLKYEAEDLFRKQADPIFRTVEVLPKLATIKLEGGSVIYHTQGTLLADPGVTASIPVTIYHTTPSNSTSIVPGFPDFVTATTVGEYKIYYTNDTPDKYLRLTTPTKRSVYVRPRPVLSLVGASTVYNPLGQSYVDLGVNVTQSGESSPTVTISFNKPNVQLSQTQTVTYTAKDQFGIEAIPITREVIVRKRPTITTSGTLYRIRNDPIAIPPPTIDPTNLTSSLQSSNNININENGTYTLTYNVTDGDGIPANTTRQSYNVGSYGKLVLLKSGYVSTLSKDGKTLAVYNTSVQIYKKELDGSWNESGHITTDSTVTSMAITSDGRYIIIGSSSYLTIGIVRVYKRNDLFQNGWEQFGFEIYGVDYLGYFGHGVDINDDATRIIISAPEANTNSGTILKAGSLKIFDLQNDFWIQNTQVIEGLSPFELLGTSVSMSGEGDIIAIGSPGYARTTVSGSTLTTSNVGKTSVYRYRDNVWGLMGNAIEDGTIEKRNAYSISLSIDGNSIAVGSQSGGGVRVYNFSGGDWRPLGSQISGTFGKSVSLSGNTVVIGSEDESSGRVYIYNFTGGDWSRVGATFEKIIVGTGRNVSITADGTSICVTSQNDVRIYSI